MGKIIFVDIDGVLIKNQTQKLFLTYLFKKGEIAYWKALVIYAWFFLYKIGICKDVIKIRKFAYETFDGWNKETMLGIIDDFYHKIAILNLNQSFIKRLKHHQSEKDTIVFLSATIYEIAEYLGEVFNVKNIIATKMEYKNGKFTGRIEGDIPYGNNKVKSARDFINKNNLDLNESVAYCDHYSDLDLLLFVNKPIVVRPDNKLIKIALKNKWEILNN